MTPVRATPPPARKRGGRRPPGRGNVYSLEAARLLAALDARVRYRYVRPRIEREGAGWKIVSPNCSRNIEPAGGEIDVAWFEPAGAGPPRLPNTSCLRFGELDADLVLGQLERAGVCASSGAACAAGGTQPPHVLLAMRETPARARAGIRFSLGRPTTDADIDHAIAAARQALAPLLQPALEPAA